MRRMIEAYDSNCRSTGTYVVSLEGEANVRWLPNAVEPAVPVDFGWLENKNQLFHYWIVQYLFVLLQLLELPVAVRVKWVEVAEEEVVLVDERAVEVVVAAELVALLWWSVAKTQKWMSNEERGIDDALRLVVEQAVVEESES